MTAAGEKQAHRERCDLARQLAAALHRPERDHDLIAHLVDPTSVADREALLAAVSSVSVNTRREVQRGWELRAEAIKRQTYVVVDGALDSTPSWWPVASAKCFTIHGMLAGPQATRAPAQVRVFYGVPYDAYVNPIQRKASEPQGAPGQPFLVAIDVLELPGAFRELPAVLGGKLHSWPALSGVLLFQQVSHAARIGWLWRLIGNPHAAVPLPGCLADGRADLGETMETGVELGGQG